MANVTLSRVEKKVEGDVESFYLITPATADHLDTISAQTFLNGRSCVGLDCFDITSGISRQTSNDVSGSATTLSADGDITIGMADGLTNHSCCIRLDVLR